MITHEEANSLINKVYAVVNACPEGRVTTYGWIAKAVGYPKGARMVGWIMNESPQGVPAQRVINSKGELSGSWAFDPPGLMRQLLEQEGVLFTDDGRVDLKRYGWDPTRDLSVEELQALLGASPADPATASEGLLRIFNKDIASPFRG